MIDSRWQRWSQLAQSKRGLLERSLGHVSTVYNPESDVIAEIERLEIDARNMRRRLEKTSGAEDRRVLDKLLKETEQRIEILRKRLP